MNRKSLLTLPLFLLACGSDVASVDPTYSAISENILVPTCATSSCHAGASPAGGLDLTGANGFEQLSGTVESDFWAGTEWEGFARVAPGDVSASALVAALEQSEGVPQQLRMPSGSRLPDEWVESIKTWIANGAKND